MTLHAPDFLALGHVAKDRDPNTSEFRTGGTAAYSALTAARLGLRTALTTSLSCRELLSPLGPDIQLFVAPSPNTTTFINDYSLGPRRQQVSSIAGTIQAQHVPHRWREASIVHIGPIAREIEPGIIDLFPDALVCVSPQGWMRRWDDAGEVTMGPWENAELVLSRADILVLSEEDTAHEPGLEQSYSSTVPVVVLTQGSRGAQVYARGDRFHVPAFPSQTVDPTGAGDVYAAAFAIRYHETRNPLDAATFAACTASFVVEGWGLEAIPTRKQVTTRLDQWGLGSKGSPSKTR